MGKTSAERFAHAYLSRARVEWGKRRPCDLCGRVATFWEPNQNAHVVAGGTGMKSSWRFLVTACDTCHRQIDSGKGKRTIERERGEKLRDIAARVLQAWHRHEAGLVF